MVLMKLVMALIAASTVFPMKEMHGAIEPRRISSTNMSQSKNTSKDLPIEVALGLAIKELKKNKVELARDYSLLIRRQSGLPGWSIVFNYYPVISDISYTVTVYDSKKTRFYQNPL